LRWLDPEEVVRLNRASCLVDDQPHHFRRGDSTLDESGDGGLLTAQPVREFFVGEALLAEIIIERHATPNTAMVYSQASDYSAVGVTVSSHLRQIMPMRYPLRLAQHRKTRGLTQAKLAEMLGVEQPTVQRWEAGTRTPDLDDIGNIADALQVTPGELFRMPNITDSGPPLYVKGAVAAGVWREAYEWEDTDWVPFTGRSDLSYPMEFRFGLRVEGDSMNQIYPHGTIVECVSAMGGIEIVSGKRVIILRRREDLEFEATVKELIIEKDGTHWLVPRSDNPAFQAPVKIDGPEPGIIETRIIAVVVGSYRPEPL